MTLLLSSDDGEWIIFLIAGIIGLLITLYIARAVFGVARFKRCQDAQIKLLAQIAEKQGVDEYTIKAILSKVDDPD